MGWDKDSLLTKAEVFFDRANNEDQDDIFYGLYCTMGVELLIRAVVSNVSPALLADPKDQNNILHVFNLGGQAAKKSIPTSQALAICRKIVPEINDDTNKVISAMINRRNEEVHTGTAAFKEYQTNQWQVEFYRFCKLLAVNLGADLTVLFGKDNSEAASLMIDESDKQVTKTVKDNIQAFKKVFMAKPDLDKDSLAASAENSASLLSYKGHHKVVCPACECAASVKGKEYGKEIIEHKEGEIITRRTVMPINFKCSACGLSLSGYGEVNAAGLGTHYKSRVTMTPEEYYELIDPTDSDAMSYYIEEYLAENAYCNE